jgi:hypothetical protein
MNPITVFLTIACLAVGAALGATGHLYAAVPVVIVAIIIAAALKMANTWEKFVILRAGKLRGVKGAGLFLILPVIDRVVAIIDERIQTTAFDHLLVRPRRAKGGFEHHELSRGHRSGLADLASRNDRLVDAGGAALGAHRGR